MAMTHVLSEEEPIVGLRALREETLGDPRVTVAVLDGPVQVEHPCFDGAELGHIETVATSMAGLDGPAAAHGTQVASILLGQPESPVEGVAPRCSGVLAPVFADGRGGAPVSCSQLDLARAITHAALHPAHVINISGGQITASGDADPELNAAVRLCADNNVLVVAAAGNDACDCLHVPASLPSVLVVGASDAHGDPLPSSNWGTGYAQQGVLAPGDGILAAGLDGGTVRSTGTSFATPLVAGVAALLLSLQVERGHAPDPQAVRAALLETATPCDPATGGDACSRSLRGRLNIPAARTRLGLEPAPAHAGAAERSDSTVVTTGGVDAATRPPEAILPTAKGAVPMGEQLHDDALRPARGEDEDLGAAPSSGAEPQADAPTAAQDGGAEQVGTSASAPGQRPTTQPSAVTEVGPPLADPLVYALGNLKIDFGTDAVRDWFALAVDGAPEDVEALLPVLEGSPSEDVIWTLTMDGSPIYAIRPEGAFAAVTYERLRDLLQRDQKTTRTAVPGVLHGSVILRSKEVVPVIIPSLRGIEIVDPEEISDEIRERLFYELRNLGVAPAERAMNSILVYGLEGVIVALAEDDDDDVHWAIEGVVAERSPVCRQDSDCWDVYVTAFNADDRLTFAKRQFRMTIDVSDVIPVPISDLRMWSAY